MENIVNVWVTFILSSASYFGLVWNFNTLSQCFRKILTFCQNVFKQCYTVREFDRLLSCHQHFSLLPQCLSAIVFFFFSICRRYEFGIVFVVLGEEVKQLDRRKKRVSFSPFASIFFFNGRALTTTNPLFLFSPIAFIDRAGMI